LAKAFSKLEQGQHKLTMDAIIGGLDAAMAEATKIRNAESAMNAETVSDSQEAQTAVAQALTVLREFYAKAAEATAMVQLQAWQSGAMQAQPTIFNSPSAS